MINFIICEDNRYVRKIYEDIISKITMPYDFTYNMYSFSKYDSKLKNIINTPSDLNIYLLELELPGKSRIEIAREIRKIDWDSIIIVLTSHDELELRVLKEKLLILDFISKFEDYENRLIETIKMVIEKSNIKNSISFKSNKELHHVKIDNILYVSRDTYQEKTKIVTTDNEYFIRDGLLNTIKKLDERFYQTHRACFINTERIQFVDFKKNIVYFENDKSIDLLSRNYKKGLKEKL